METEQTPQHNWLSWLITLITPIVAKLATNEVDLLKAHIDNAAVKAADLAPCPAGYTRAADGSCQPDPVPPDPTHPHE